MQYILELLKDSFDKEECGILKDVFIKKITRNNDSSLIFFYLSSTNIISYELLNKIRLLLIKALNISSNVTVKVIPSYELSKQYTINDIYNEEKNNYFAELNDIDPILTTILRSSKIDFTEEEGKYTLNITVTGSKLLKSRYEFLTKYFKNVFYERYNINLFVNLCIDISLNDEISKKFDKYEKEDNKTVIIEVKEQAEPIGMVKGTVSENKYRKLMFYDDDVNVYGKILTDVSKNIPINQVRDEMSDIIVVGVISKVEFKNGIISIILTDNNDSINCVIMTGKNSTNSPSYITAERKLKIGLKCAIKGNAVFDTYCKDITIKNVKSIKILEYKENILIDCLDPYYIMLTERLDESNDKRVELHLHTKNSELDGVGAVEEYIETARRFGMKSIAITDHGCVQGLSDADHYIKSKRYKDLKIIMGVEGYLVDDDIATYMNSNFKEIDDDYDLSNEFTIINITTTGNNVQNDKIIEISCKKIVNNLVGDEYYTKVNPNKPLSFKTKDETGLRDEDLINAISEEQALKELIEFSKHSKVFVNATPLVSLKFLKDRYKVYGLDFDKNIIDLSTLARTLYEKIKKIDIKSIAKALKLNDVEYENIIDKTNICSSIFQKEIDTLINEYSVNNLNELNKTFVKDNDFIKRLKSNHIILLAKNDIGRVNLYKLVSDSFINYFYKRPKIPRKELIKYREGLIIGSACIAGELMTAIKEGKSDDELERIASFYDYLEIQPLMNNSFLLNSEENFKTKEDLIKLNKKVIELGEKLNKLVVATCDCHYVNKEDKLYRTMLRFSLDHQKKNQNKDGTFKKSELTLEESECDDELYFRTTDEMLKEFEYLGEEKAYEVVIKNTNLINNMIEEDLSPVRPDKCPPVIENSDDELRKACYKKFNEVYGDNPPQDFADRLNIELNRIIDNGYSVMYISAKRLIDDSLDHGYTVGSRGSVGSSFAATMAGITEVNPLPPHYICPNCKYVEYNTEETKKYENNTGFDMPDKCCPHCNTNMLKEGINIPFATFLGVDGGKVKEPDIDLNFSSEYQNLAHEKTKELFGDKFAFKAGTVGTIASKTAFGYVKKYVEYNNIYYHKAGIETIKNGLINVKRTTGQHAGGMIILPQDEEIYTFTPIQYPANKESEGITTHFDYHKIDSNLLKLDLLGHTSPTFLKKLYELTNVNPLTIPFYEQDVISLFKNTEALGIKPEDICNTKLGCLSVPEFGTDFAMNLLLEAKPETVADLIRIAGLAHGTDVWRNNTQTIINNNIAKLNECICCRDDIMMYLIDKGIDKSLSFEIMESVRKGNKLKPDWEQIMREHSVPEWYIESCNKIKYMFPKAHAAAYVVASLRVAYYKLHYPAEYYSAYFSIKNKHIDYASMCTSLENVRFNLQKLGYKTEFDDGSLNENDNNNLDQKEIDDSKSDNLITNLRITEEMLARGVEWTPIDIYKAKPFDFTVVDGKVMPSLISIEGLGDKAAISFYEEAQKEPFKSKKDIKDRTIINDTILNKMTEYGLLDGLKDKEEEGIFEYFGTAN